MSIFLILISLLAHAEHRPKKALPVPQGVIQNNKIKNQQKNPVTLLPGGFCEDPYTILCLASEVATRRERLHTQTLNDGQRMVNESIEKVKEKYLGSRVILKDRDVFTTAYYPDYLTFLYQALDLRVESPKSLSDLKTTLSKTIEDEVESPA